MSLSLLKRLVQGRALTPQEHDQNLTDIEAAVNANTTGLANAGSGIGTTLPSTPSLGTRYFHTDLMAEVVWNGSAWILNDGNVSGDYKWYDADPAEAEGTTADFASGTLNTVLGKHPGYSTVGASIAGRTLVAAGSGSGLTARTVRDSLGAENHTLSGSEQGNINVEVEWETDSTSGGDGTVKRIGMNGQDFNQVSADTTQSATVSLNSAPNAHNNMQPTYVAWLLKKD